MHIYEIALLLVALLFGVYGWLSCLELGVSLLRLSKNTPVDEQRSNQLFTPIWEITNVFLVFGVTGFAVFFNNSLVSVSKELLPVLSIGIVSLLARACTVLYIYYHKNQLGPTLANWLFTLTSFMVPMSFAAAGVYLLLGQQFWQSAPGWAFFVTAGLTIVTTALLFANKLSGTKSVKLDVLSKIMVLCLGFCGAVVLQGLVIRQVDHLVSYGFVALMVGFDALLLALVVTLLRKQRLSMLWPVSGIIIFAPILLVLANNPFLVYPTYTVTAAYGAQSFGLAAVIGFAVIFPIIAVGGYLFTKLFTSQKQ